MKVHRLRFIVGSLLTFALPLLLIYLLIATNIGLQSMAWLAQRFTPGLIQLELQGRLIGPIHLQNIEYQNTAIAFQLKQANIDWQPSALFSGNVLINNLQVDGFTIHRINTESHKKKKKNNFNWLKHLQIKNIQLQNIKVEPSGLQLALQGSLVKQWNIQWQLQLPHQIITKKTAEKTVANPAPLNKLAAILQFISGQLTAKGVIQGERLTPRIQADINASDLTANEIKAAHLQVQLATDLTPHMNSVLTIEAAKLHYKNYLFNTFSLQAQGQLNPLLALNWHLKATLVPSQKNYQGDIVAQGNINGDYKTPRIIADINVKQGRWNAARFSLLKARLAADFTKAGQSQLQVQLNDLKIKKYHFSPVQLKAVLKRAQQTLNIQIAQGAVRYSSDTQMRTFSWQASTINLYQQAKDFMLQGRLILNAQQYLTVNFQLPNYQFLTPLEPQQPVQGKISLSIQQIAPFLSSISSLQNVQGLLRADLQIAGTYAKPVCLGAISLANARVDVPELNLQIRAIYLKAQSNPAGIINWTGQAQSGQGILYLKGNTALHQTDYPSSIILTGRNITVSDTEHYQIIATPDLQANYKNKRLTLTGSITVPKSRLMLGGVNQGEAITLSKDVVFVNKKQKPSYHLPFYAQIQLKLGNDIQLNYEGLTTQLHGQVLLNDAPNHAVTGLGQIDFHKGKYTYYGQTLTIRSGSRINFNGAVENPILNIQAVKPVEAIPTTPTTAGDIVPTNTDLSSMAVLQGQTIKIIVGVNVQGNIKNPQITLFSEPSILNQTDILSYLIVGQPASQLGSGSAGLLFNAASSLNFGGASQIKDVVQELKKTVGVEFNIQSSSYLNPATNQTQQNTALVLGKALSPRLYISYSIGILASLNTLQLRYFLSKYWTLQSTTSSVGNGVDLLYMFERGK